jgi:hypothetical protein
LTSLEEKRCAVKFSKATIEGGPTKLRLIQKTLCSLLAVLISTVSGPWQVLGQQATSTIVGTVVDAQQNPVSGIKIVIKDPSGKVLSETVTDGEGRYSLENLTPGQYQLTLDPIQPPFQGETVVASLGPQGLTVDWIVSESAKAIAVATPGIAPSGPFALGATGKAIIGGVFVSGWLGSLIWGTTATGTVTSSSQ